MIKRVTLLSSMLLMAISLPASAQFGFGAVPLDEIESVPHTPERLPNGDLNITGFWITPGAMLDTYLGPSGTRTVSSDEKQMNGRSKRGDIPAMKSPYDDMYQNAIDNPVDRGRLCLPAGMPLMMIGVYGLEILQTPDQITITSEWGPYSRRIWMDESHPPLEELNPTFNGHSVGHWDGDTLVVDTIGLREDTPLDPTGIPHSANTRIIERFNMVKPGVLIIDISVEDPDVFVEPWQYSYQFKYKPDFRLQEYVCMENNLIIE